MKANCSICSDQFFSGADVSAIPCGHVFHSICILQWFENSKTCPQCRVKCTCSKLVKLYFDSSFVEDSEEKDVESLEFSLINTKHKLLLSEQEMSNHKKDAFEIRSKNTELLNEIKKFNEQLKSKKSKISDLESKLEIQRDCVKKLRMIQSERDIAVAKCNSYDKIRLLLTGVEGEVTEILDAHSASDNIAAKNLAQVVAMLKRQLNDITKKLRTYDQQLRQTKSHLKLKNNQHLELQNQLKSYKSDIETKIEDIIRLEEYNTKLNQKIHKLESILVSPSTDNKQSRALHRLLSENITPQNMKRIRQSSDEMENLTPEVIKKTKSSLNENKNIFSCDETDLFEENSCVNNVSKKPIAEPTVKNVINLDTTVYKPQSDSSPYLPVKYNSCLLVPTNRKRNGLANPPLHTKPSFSKNKSEDCKLSGMNYNGLGGHHKGDDDFPKPSLVKIKSNRSLKISIASKSSKNNTISNFFKNTFED